MSFIADISVLFFGGYCGYKIVLWVAKFKKPNDDSTPKHNNTYEDRDRQAREANAKRESERRAKEDAEERKRQQARREEQARQRQYERQQEQKNTRQENHRRPIRKWYEVLGVPENSQNDIIKAAYRRKIVDYHPDKMTSLGEDFRLLAEERSKEINEAYQFIRTLRSF